MKLEQKMNESQNKNINFKEKESVQSQSLFSRLLRLAFSREFIKQGLKFAIVGAIGTLVNLSFLYLLTDIFSIIYLLSETIAFIISVINNYIFNKVFTFKEDIQEKVVKKGIKFTIICIIALCVNLFVLFVLVEYFNIFYLFAEIFAIICASSINFLGNRFWTFRYQIKKDLKQTNIKRIKIGFIMAIWLIILSIIDLSMGFINNDSFFFLLGVPLLVSSIILILRLIKIKLTPKNQIKE